MESPVQAEEGPERQIRPVITRSRDAERTQVAKHVSHAPRKAAIAYKTPVP